MEACLMLCSKNVADSHQVGGLQNMAGQKYGLHPICSWGPTDYSQTLRSLWTVALQAPLSMGFSRQEYWSGLPFPSPGDLPDPGIKPASLKSPAWAGRFFTTAPPEKSIVSYPKTI